MKSCLWQSFFLGILLLPSILTAASKIVLLEPVGESPAIVKTADRMLREKLSSKGRIYLVDYKETLRFIYESEFALYPQPSEKLFMLFKEKFGDSIFVLWINIRHLNFMMVRKMFIKAAVKGELKIHLNIYKTPDDTLLYSEDIISFVNKNKGFIFFSSPENTIPLSTIEKERLIEELLESATEKIVATLLSFLTKENTDSTQLKDSTNNNNNKIGSTAKK